MKQKMDAGTVKEVARMLRNDRFEDALNLSIRKQVSPTEFVAIRERLAMDDDQIIKELEDDEG